MKKQFDVIIIGSGPAGVSAAIYCRNNNLDVLLIDKKVKSKIGDKVCGEAISKRTVTDVSSRLNIDPPKDDEINAEVEKLVLKTALPEDHLSLPAIGYMVDRFKYGQRLLQEALNRGVILLDNTKFDKPIIENKKIIGITIKQKDGKIEDYYSKIVMDCSGVLAVVRTKLPDDFEPKLNNKVTKSDYASCYREIIELDYNHNLEGKIILQYERDIPEPGYIWFFADGEKKLNCGTGFIKEGENEKRSVKKVYSKAMEKYYSKETYKVLDGRGDIVSIRPPLWNAVGPGLIVAGDAAFHADPLTAEGHGPALLAGCSAGEIIWEAIKKDSYQTKDLWKYNQLIMKEFGAEHAKYRVLTISLEKIGPEKLEFLLKRKVIKQSDLKSEGMSKDRSFMEYLNIAIRCFPRFGLLLRMKRAIDVSKEVEQLCETFPESPNEFNEWKAEITSCYTNIS